MAERNEPAGAVVGRVDRRIQGSRENGCRADFGDDRVGRRGRRIDLDRQGGAQNVVRDIGRIAQSRSVREDDVDVSRSGDHQIVVLSESRDRVGSAVCSAQRTEHSHKLGSVVGGVLRHAEQAEERTLCGDGGSHGVGPGGGRIDPDRQYFSGRVEYGKCQIAGGDADQTGLGDRTGSVVGELGRGIPPRREVAARFIVDGLNHFVGRGGGRIESDRQLARYLRVGDRRVGRRVVHEEDLHVVVGRPWRNRLDEQVVIVPVQDKSGAGGEEAILEDNSHVVKAGPGRGGRDQQIVVDAIEGNLDGRTLPGDHHFGGVKEGQPVARVADVDSRQGRLDHRLDVQTQRTCLHLLEGDSGVNLDQPRAGRFAERGRVCSFVIEMPDYLLDERGGRVDVDGQRAGIGVEIDVSVIPHRERRLDRTHPAGRRDQIGAKVVHVDRYVRQGRELGDQRSGIQFVDHSAGGRGSRVDVDHDRPSCAVVVGNGLVAAGLVVDDLDVDIVTTQAGTGDHPEVVGKAG